jgi:hypothetical protein
MALGDKSAGLPVSASKRPEDPAALVGKPGRTLYKDVALHGDLQNCLRIGASSRLFAVVNAAPV